jgi:hypothetical protein
MRARWLDTVRRGVLVALACLAAACDGNGTPDGGQDGDGGDGGPCPTLCAFDEDCCPGSRCRDGTCGEGPGCPSGCNSECDQAAGQVCDQGTHECIQGSPPLNCLTDCNCYSGEVCDQGACVPACSEDADCAAGLACDDGLCRPAACSAREDCVPLGGCLVCVEQRCAAEPAVCVGDRDCCVGRRCNFGTCVPPPTPCETDADCVGAPFPRCAGGTCQPWPNECVSDIDCRAGEVCRNRACVSCSPESCDPGQWCDPADGACKPGCDANDDCAPPLTCVLAIHTCGQTDCCDNACVVPAYCDTASCTCADPCVRGDCTAGACSLYPHTTCDEASGKCVACPQEYRCDPDTGRCVCSESACPTGSTCDETTGMCEADQGHCDPPCVPPQVCGVDNSCVVTEDPGQDGTPCYLDAECDASQGYLCDSSVACVECVEADPDFAPGFVCREECSLLTGGCTNPAYTCKLRHTGMRGLCVPADVP